VSGGWRHHGNLQPRGWGHRRPGEPTPPEFGDTKIGGFHVNVGLLF